LSRDTPFIRLWAKHRPGRLTVRLSAWVLVTALPSLLVGGWLFAAVHRELVEVRQRGADSLAHLAIESLDRLLYERDRDTLVFAGLPVVRAFDQVRMADVADQLVRGYPPYYELVLAVDRTGRIVAANRVDGTGAPVPTAQLIGRSVAEEPWFNNALAAEEPVVVVDDAHLDPLVEAVVPAQRPVVSFSAPIKGASGGIVGVWSTRVSLAALKSVLVRHAGAEIYSDFPLVVRSPRQADALFRIGPWPSSEAGKLPRLASVTSVGFRGWPGLGWRVEVYQPAGSLDRPAILAGLAVWIGLLVAGGGIGLGLIVHRRVVRPMVALKELAEGRARLAQTVPVEPVVAPAEFPSCEAPAGQRAGSDELGDLVRAVGTMVREVDSQVARLTMLNGIASGFHRELLSLPTLLTRIVQTARELTGARYAALGLFDETGERIDQLITDGIDDATRAAIGQLPTGRGLLGAILKAEGVLRVADVRQHEAFSGFPPHHPVMTSFLGTAILAHGRVFGRLYLANKEAPEGESAQFTELDAELIAALAGLATSAIENAALLRELMASEARSRAILHAVDDGVIGVDLSGLCLFVNRAGAAKLGYQPDELVGQRVHQTIHPKRADGHPCADAVCPLFEVGRTSQSRRLNDEVLWCRDGTSIPVTCLSSPLYDEAGAVIGAVISFTDLTERQRLDQRLRQSQKLEALGRLAGGIAHDFNNILTAILGYSTLLLAQVDPDRRPYVDQIKKAGERGAALTKQILDFSRQRVTAPQVVDLHAILSEMEPLLRRLIGEDIDLLLRSGAGSGRVKVDPTQLEQVVMNLALNARDAMPDGGRLTMETGNVELDDAYCRTHPDTRPGSYVMLAVSDNGHGMDAVTLARCIEPFFTTKPEGKGTGLGLSTVYGIVKQCGGALSLYSEPGRGTTVKVLLPQVMEELTPPVPAEWRSAKATPHPETILVVEDDQAVRAFVHTVLAECGYTMLVAANGEEAREICAHHPGQIHLLLTDLVIAGINGRRLAESLQAQRHDLKVLYMSGYAENAMVHQAVLDPTVAFLPKPFTADALRSKVRAVLST
jgi:PAS domain S-box-containing protein